MPSVPISSYLYANHLASKRKNEDQVRGQTCGGYYIHSKQKTSLQELSQLVHGKRSSCMGAQLTSTVKVDVCAEYRSFLIVCKVIKKLDDEKRGW